MSPDRVWKTKFGKLERFYWNGKWVFYLDNKKIDPFHAARILHEYDSKARQDQQGDE